MKDAAKIIVMEEENVRVFTASECGSCSEVKAALEAGNFEVVGIEGPAQVQQIDLEEGDNFEYFDTLNMDAVPSAYHGVQQCKIFIDEQTRKVTFDCRPATSEGGTPNEQDTSRNLSEPAGV